MKDKKLLPYIFGLITGVILLPVTDELLNYYIRGLRL